MAKKEKPSNKVQDDVITGEAPMGPIEMMSGDTIVAQPDETKAGMSA